MSGAEAAPRIPERGLALALEILEHVARSDYGITAAELARAVGASRATVYRVVNALVRDEFLVRRPDLTGFLLGTRVRELAAVVETRRVAAPHAALAHARSVTGEAIHLFDFHRSGISIVDEDPRLPLADRASLLSDPRKSAVGQLWLLGHVDRAMENAPQWRVRATKDDITAVREAFAVRGYTEQATLLAPGRACIAVAVSDALGVAVGAVTLSTATSRLSTVVRHVATLRSAAEQIAGFAISAPSGG